MVAIVRIALIRYVQLVTERCVDINLFYVYQEKEEREKKKEEKEEMENEKEEKEEEKVEEVYGISHGTDRKKRSFDEFEINLLPLRNTLV